MPIMAYDSIMLSETTYYQYVRPLHVDTFTSDGWRIVIPEPVHPSMRVYYMNGRTNEPPETDALADWERELLDATPAPVTTEPEAEAGDDEPDDEAEDNTFECEWCHDVNDLDTQYQIGSPRHVATICQSCYGDARECDNCGRPIDTCNDNYDTVGEWDPTFFCEGCSHYPRWCDNCDSSYDGRYYDSCPGGCYDGSGLHDYSHKPMPEFHIIDRGTPTRVFARDLHTTRRELVSVPFMGFELEMERNGSSTHINEIVDRVYEMWHEFAYCKHDGSLSDGLELVTHPFTLEYAQQHINWDLLEGIRKDGYRSWNTTTSGMHVHVNRATFTGPAHLFRFAQLIYKNEPTCCSFAGRSNNSYATFQDGYQKGYLASVVKGRARGSRGAVNMTNPDTIEVRIFRGSLRYQRVLANLEFVNACVEYTRQLTVPDVVRGGLSWRTFATWILDNRVTYPHLFDYLDLNPTNPNHTNEPALATY